MGDDDWYKPHRAPTPQRQPTPGELLFEFHAELTHTFYRVELRDHGEFSVEGSSSNQSKGGWLECSDVTWTQGAHLVRWRSRGPSRSGQRLKLPIKGGQGARR